jgi:ribonucleoside-triphosphate reductase
VECLLVIGVLTLWALSTSVRDNPGLLTFFLYGIPSEFIVALVPHEPAVLYMATLHSPLTVAVVAGAGTLVAEIVNWQLLSSVAATSVVDRVLRTRPVVRVGTLFERAPFSSLWIAGLVPVVPFLPVRVLAVARGYPRSRFLVAAVTSRALRFYLLGLAAAAVQFPVEGTIIVLVMLVLLVTIPSAYRFLQITRVPLGTERPVCEPSR